jgi:hypothetical protein
MATVLIATICWALIYGWHHSKHFVYFSSHNTQNNIASTMIMSFSAEKEIGSPNIHNPWVAEPRFGKVCSWKGLNLIYYLFYTYIKTIFQKVSSLKLMVDRKIRKAYSRNNKANLFQYAGALNIPNLP